MEKGASCQKKNIPNILIPNAFWEMEHIAKQIVEENGKYEVARVTITNRLASKWRIMMKPMLSRLTYKKNF